MLTQHSASLPAGGACCSAAAAPPRGTHAPLQGGQVLRVVRKGGALEEHDLERRQLAGAPVPRQHHLGRRMAGATARRQWAGRQQGLASGEGLAPPQLTTHSARPPATHLRRRARTQVLQHVPLPPHGVVVPALPAICEVVGAAHAAAHGSSSPRWRRWRQRPGVGGGASAAAAGAQGGGEATADTALYRVRRA